MKKERGFRTAHVRILAVAAILLAATLAFASCGDDKGPSEDPAVGVWTLETVEYMGQTVEANQWVEAGTWSELPVFEIREDATAVFSLMDRRGVGEITANGDGTYQMTDDSGAIDFEIDDEGKLRMDYESLGVVMTFAK